MAHLMSKMCPLTWVSSVLSKGEDHNVSRFCGRPKKRKRAASAVWPRTWRAQDSSVVRACARRGRFLSLLLPVDHRAGGGSLHFLQCGYWANLRYGGVAHCPCLFERFPPNALPIQPNCRSCRSWYAVNCSSSRIWRMFSSSCSLIVFRNSGMLNDPCSLI
jgi:hypothetical protein